MAYNENTAGKDTAFVPGMVSTIIPVYNRNGLLQEAVESVLQQSYRPIEIIIVDDGSTDDTSATADRLAALHPGEITALHQPNSGVGVAREAGRQLARGEFIQYLDSDDLLYPRKFELQVRGLRDHPECGAAYCKTDYRIPGSTLPPISWKRTGERIETMFPAFLASRWWGTLTPLYRRALVDRAGPWLSLINEEDWEYDCRIAAMGVKLFFADEFLALVRAHPEERLSHNGLSPAKLRSRAAAHMHIFKHAKQAGIPDHSAEMRHFARELFLLARQSGAAGLDQESAQLFALARTASEKDRGHGMDFILYGLCARLIGWSAAGRLAGLLDRFRRSVPRP